MFTWLPCHWFWYRIGTLKLKHEQLTLCQFFSFLSAFVNRLKSFLSNTFFIRYVYSFNQIADMSCSLEAISTFPIVKTPYALFLGLKSQNVILLPSLPDSWLMFHKSFQVVSINFSLDLEFHIGSVTYDQHDSISTCSFTHAFLPCFTHSFIQYILIGWLLDIRYCPRHQAYSRKQNKNSYLHGVPVLLGGDRQYTNTCNM